MPRVSSSRGQQRADKGSYVGAVPFTVAIHVRPGVDDPRRLRVPEQGIDEVWQIIGINVAVVVQVADYRNNREAN